MKRRELVPKGKEGWKRPVRLPVYISAELFTAIENRKWAEHRSMAELVNEVLEREFLK